MSARHDRDAAHPLLSEPAIAAGAQAIYLPSAYCSADEIARSGMHARAENCIRAALDAAATSDSSEAERLRAILLRERDPQSLGSLAFQLRELAEQVDATWKVIEGDPSDGPLQEAVDRLLSLVCAERDDAMDGIGGSIARQALAVAERAAGSDPLSDDAIERAFRSVMRCPIGRGVAPEVVISVENIREIVMALVAAEPAEASR